LSELKITSRTVTTFYTTVDQTFNKECRVNNAVSGMVMVREKEGCLCLSFRSIGLAGLEKPKSNQTNSNSRPPFVVIVGDRQAPGTIELNFIAPDSVYNEATYQLNIDQCIAASTVKNHCPSKRPLHNTSQQRQLAERLGQWS
jgi:hypothetical protein